MSIADIPRDIFKASKKKESASGPSTPANQSATKLPTSSDAASDAATAGTSTVQSPPPGSYPQAGETRSETASISSSALPSLTVTRSATEENASEAPRDEGRGRSMETQSSASQAGDRSGTPNQQALGAPPSPAREKSPVGFNIESAYEASKGVGRVVNVGVKTPMNFCLGLARGFRNAPRLYNDDTVRPVEKVTDFNSGIKVAGKELGLGLYDGITGLITQPMKGAEKEGAVGLIKGIGKGVGGLILKPAAGAWAVPAYTMRAVHVGIRGYFSSSVMQYIIASRVQDGIADYNASTAQEREDVLARWGTYKDELKPFLAAKNSEKRRSQAHLDLSKVDNHFDGAVNMEGVRNDVGGTSGASSTTAAAGAVADSTSTQTPQKTSWFHRRAQSFEDRKKKHPKHHEEVTIPGHGAVGAVSGPRRHDNDDSDADSEYERAIAASVAETSRGNAEEDARVEAAIRESLNHMRAAQGHGLGGLPAGVAGAAGVSGPGAVAPGGGAPGSLLPPSLPDRRDENEQITDEEYQSYIEQAIQQSILEQQRREQQGLVWREQGSQGQGQGQQQQQHEEQQQGVTAIGTTAAGAAAPPPAARDVGAESDDEELRRAIEASKTTAAAEPQDEELQRALEESKASAVAAAASGIGDDDEEMRRVIAESKAAYDAGGAGLRLQQDGGNPTGPRSREDEEAIVLEYVRKQSLAEEELRRRNTQKGKGRAGSGADEYEDDDDELRRAIEMSLNMDHQEGAGPSELPGSTPKEP